VLPKIRLSGNRISQGRDRLVFSPLMCWHAKFTEIDVKNVKECGGMGKNNVNLACQNNWACYAKMRPRFEKKTHF
jgi:hypothetical protein